MILKTVRVFRTGLFNLHRCIVFVSLTMSQDVWCSSYLMLLSGAILSIEQKTLNLIYLLMRLLLPLLPLITVDCTPNLAFLYVFMFIKGFHISYLFIFLTYIERHHDLAMILSYICLSLANVWLESFLHDLVLFQRYWLLSTDDGN